jgi:type IV pilus assembly protein PilX
MMRPHHRSLTPYNVTTSGQRGVVLVVALLLLLILTLIGLAASRGSWLELRMAGNTQDKDVAFQAAEAALVNCENILTRDVLPTFSRPGTDGYFKIDGTENTPARQRTAWGDSDSIGYSGPALKDTAGNGIVAQPPRCIIEQLPPRPPAGGSIASDTANVTVMYRVTARAVGASKGSVVLLQTTYRR